MKRSDWYQKRAKNITEPRQWYRIQNKADNTTAQIDIYDEIDPVWGIGAANFRRDLLALSDSIKTIDLHINSPGGDVYDAIAIMNSLRQHDARVVTTVDGVAASSAGFIAVGASDELVMAPNSEIMAHLPWAIVIGDSTDMRKTADDLDRIGSNIASMFAARAGGSVDEWLTTLQDETWWSAQEAVDAGIADRVLADKSKSDATKNAFDLSVFNHAGRSNAPAPRIPLARNQTPPPNEAEVTQGKEPDVATLSESLVEKLGLDAEADDAAILEAFEAKLAEKPDPAPEGEPAAPPEPTAEQLGQVAAKFGLAVMDKTVADQLTAEARLGAEARAQQIREADDRTIRDALTSGRITPASSATWREELSKNREGTKALLATLPANSAVPVHEIGHGVDNEDSQLETEMASAFNKVTGRVYGKEA